MKRHLKKTLILATLMLTPSIILPALIVVSCSATKPTPPIAEKPTDPNPIQTNANRIANEFKLTPKTSYLQANTIKQFVDAINSHDATVITNYFNLTMPTGATDFTISLNAVEQGENHLSVEFIVTSEIDPTISVSQTFDFTYVTNTQVAEQAATFTSNFNIFKDSENVSVTLNEIIGIVNRNDITNLNKYFSFGIPNVDFTYALSATLKAEDTIEIVANIQSRYVPSITSSKTFDFSYETYRLDDGKYHVPLADEYSFYKFNTYGDSFVTDFRSIKSRTIDSDIVGVNNENSLLTVDEYANLINSNPSDLYDVIKNTITVGLIPNPGAYSILPRLTFLNYAKALEIDTPTAEHNIKDIILSKKNYRINRIELVPNSIVKANDQISFKYVLKRNYTVADDTASNEKQMTIMGLNTKQTFINTVSNDKYATAVAQNNPYLKNTKFKIGQDEIRDPDGTKYGSQSQKDLVNENYFRAFTFGYDIYNGSVWERSENGTIWLLKRVDADNNRKWYALTNVHVLAEAFKAQALNKTVNFYTKHSLVTWEYSTEMINQAYEEVPGTGNQGLIDRAKILREQFRYEINQAVTQDNLISSGPSDNVLYWNDIALLELDLSAMSYSKNNRPAWKDVADEFFLPKFDTLTDLSYSDIKPLSFGDGVNSFDSDGPLYYFSNPIPNDASRYSIEEVYKIYNKNNTYLKAGIGSVLEDSDNAFSNPNLFFSHANILGGSSGGMILNANMKPVGIVTSLISSSKMSYVNGALDIGVSLQLKPIFDYMYSQKDTDPKLNTFFTRFV